MEYSLAAASAASCASPASPPEVAVTLGGFTLPSITMVEPHLRQRILARRETTFSSAIEYLAEQVGQEIFTSGLATARCRGQRKIRRSARFGLERFSREQNGRAADPFSDFHGVAPASRGTGRKLTFFDIRERWAHGWVKVGVPARGSIYERPGPGARRTSVFKEWSRSASSEFAPSSARSARRSSSAARPSSPCVMNASARIA